jgi:hypothetical protein
MPKATYALPLVIGSALMLGGCGLFVPEMHGLTEDQLDEIASENDVINQIKCEIHRAIDPKINGESVAWLANWNAKVSLVLTVDEKGSLSPGFLLTEPFKIPSKGQMFSLGGGANVSADATRKETVGFTYSDQERQCFTCRTWTLRV